MSRRSAMAAHFAKQSTGGTALPAGSGLMARTSGETAICGHCCTNVSADAVQAVSGQARPVCGRCVESRTASLLHALRERHGGGLFKCPSRRCQQLVTVETVRVVNGGTVAVCAPCGGER